MTIATVEGAPARAGLAARAETTGWNGTAPAALDQTALGVAYGAHHGAAYRLAYGILGDRPAAEDAVQDAFLKLWTGPTQFDPSRGSVLSLLLTIARFTSIDVMRRRATRTRIENTYCTDATSTTDGPEQASERVEDTRNVRRALSELPGEQRQVIEMAYFSGLTCRQIAAAMGIPTGTVKSRTRLAMRKLALTLAAPNVAGVAV